MAPDRSDASQWLPYAWPHLVMQDGAVVCGPDWHASLLPRGDELEPHHQTHNKIEGHVIMITEMSIKRNLKKKNIVIAQAVSIRSTKRGKD